ncbi:DNA topoisomerase IV [Aquimarina sp. D1M17]|uniref:DNA topoisomerase IV n=1 Tax=Aquimarina acroporae TaxID=2937283 RepID=UPI0020BD8AC9|nr:DNA topoisomerase IV [Aquimarina acroporae]MCK8520389.1 DNA topoisomerase IV [Aquimarina acroporae]
MKQIAFIFCCSLLFASCYQPERNCSNFHVGTFEFETLLNGELVKTTFVRNDSIEIDYFEGKSDTASIRWINDCEYIVQKVNPKSMSEEKAIHMKILTTDNDIYTFEYGLVGATNKQRGTAKKIK